MIVVRARPQHAEEGDWRARVLTVAERGARGVERASLAALARALDAHGQPTSAGGRLERELVIVTPGPDAARPSARPRPCVRELEAGLPGFAVTVARSRPASDPADLHRAGAEALLAANVAEARGRRALSFEETGAYRLLLPAMSEDPTELERFYDETVAPLVAYDEQYETELVRTLETFLDADGNVAGTAERLFTHRHTIRYRLERVKELTSLDVGSTDGRERLVARAEGDARARHPAARRARPGARRRGRPRAARAQGPLATQSREPAALVPGLDLEMVGGVAQPNHDELRHVQPEGVGLAALADDPSSRLRVERLLGAAGDLGVALPAGLGREAVERIAGIAAQVERLHRVLHAAEPQVTVNQL